MKAQGLSWTENRGMAISRRSFAALCALTLVGCASGGGQETEEADAQASVSDGITGTYTATVTGYDWGCAVDRMDVELSANLDAISADDLTVTEKKQAVNFAAEGMPIVEQEAPRTIVDAYLVDEAGERTTEPSNKMVLELGASPFEGSPLYLDIAAGCTSFSDPYLLSVGIADGAHVTSDGADVDSLNIEAQATETTTTADMFKTDEYKASDGVSYKFATFEVDGGSDSLVVWLHGLGEGGYEGTDPYVALLAAKAAVLGDEDFQKTVGGANILVPQCPTYWMDNDGKRSNSVNGAIEATEESFYTSSLEELIDWYAKEVGAKKIVLAGCSNGGYMTMMLAIHRPDAYAAIVPICEALPDEKITDEQIESITGLPAFFIYSKDDQTVDPTLHEEPTLERLRAADAKDLHVSTTESVIDPSGTIATEDGEPYRYEGHYSWVYFFDDLSQCDEDGLGAWDFIAQNLA